MLKQVMDVNRFSFIYFLIRKAILFHLQANFQKKIFFSLRTFNMMRYLLTGNTIFQMQISKTVLQQNVIK